MVHGALSALGSLRLTLILFIAFAIAIAVYYFTGRELEWLIAVPLFLFSVNLLCAIISNGTFRQRLPLLSFHLGLLVILVLTAIGRLTYLKGEVEVTQGEAMPPQFSRYRAGMLHQVSEEGVGFKLQRFDIEFDESQYKRYIQSHVSWQDKQGRTFHYTIADLEPLIQSGYRFYSTKHKGFAPIFSWQPKGSGELMLGSVHLPAYPENEFNQAKDWQIPGSDEQLWAMLEFDEVIIKPGEISRFRIPEEHTLVVRYEGARHELKSGQSIELPDGRLTYRELRTWMGFVVFYDWTMPWLLAACLFTVLSISWHYWEKIKQRPWQAEGQQSE